MISLPTIPKKEYELRKLKMQELMQIHGFDILFFYGDDRAVFGANHSRWIANYAPHFEPICIAMPAQGQIHAATGAESEAFFNNSAMIGEIHCVEEFNMPEEEYPYTKPISFKSYFNLISQEMAFKPVKIGLVGTSAYPGWLIELIKSQPVEIFSTQKFEIDWQKIRASKSESEVAVIKYAFELAEIGLSAGINALKIGVTERELAAEIEYAMRKLGGEGMGIDTIVGFGQKNTASILARTSSKRATMGELALLTIAPRYEGYHGVIARPICIGKPTSDVRNAIEVAIEASNAGAAVLKEGAYGSEISGATLKVLRKAGLEHYCLYSGIHSVGTSEFEPPILTSNSNFVIPSNAFFSIDIPLFHAPWGGFRIETGYFVNGDKAECLASGPPNYIEILE
jgi:Xaa-Pro dipeptidase